MKAFSELTLLLHKLWVATSKDEEIGTAEDYLCWFRASLYEYGFRFRSEVDFWDGEGDAITFAVEETFIESLNCKKSDDYVYFKNVCEKFIEPMETKSLTASDSTCMVVDMKGRLR